MIKCLVVKPAFLQLTKVLRDYIKRKGLFKALYVDRTGIFCGPKRCNFSQVKRACEEPGIEIIFANSAQGKGRIERSFETFQDRLVPEFRLKRIKIMSTANRYLLESSIREFWEKKIEVMARNCESEYSLMPKQIDLYAVLVVKEYRKIRNEHTFSYVKKKGFDESPAII